MLKREWDRFVNRVIWSWAGWRSCWQSEPSLKYWFYVNLISVFFALVIDLSGAERALILALGILLLAAELMNTGIETAIDYISTEQHELARIAKDVASGAVALTAIAGGVAWIAILVG